MFTGLISFLGQIVSIDRNNRFIWHIKIRSDLFRSSTAHIKVGDSIALNGCCCTVVAIDPEKSTAIFTLMRETLRRTTFSSMSISEQIHVERSAQLSDTIDGHVVTGHVSGMVSLKERRMSEDGSLWLIFALPTATKFLTLKGSVALDGVSLTVASLDDTRFGVCLIPHTQKVTLLSQRKIGDRCNIEVPVLPLGVEFPLEADSDFMELARRKALLGRVTAPSNPWVGCVIVNSSGQVVSTGYHRRRGDIHAEVAALRGLDPLRPQENPREERSHLTLYCTLEPCNHTGLQPPCTEAIIASGIPSVVVGILDPDSKVSGSGIERLREAGIRVTVLDDQRVTKSLVPYIHHRRAGRPFVTVKMAISLDGKIAPGSVGSSVLSGPASHQDVQKLRLKSQAILVGTSTALQDKPRLTLRLDELGESKYVVEPDLIKIPLRCFIDVHGQVKEGPLLDISRGPTLVFTSEQYCPRETTVLWQQKGVEICYLPVAPSSDQSNKGHLPFELILDFLGKRGVLSLLVEGGGSLVTSLHRHKLIDRLILYVAPKFLGKNGISLFQGDSPSHLIEEGYVLSKTKTFGSDVRITYSRQ